MESTDTEKPFQCELCDLTFISKSARRIHYLDHTGELPYECSTCGKGFRQRCTLNYHERIHSIKHPHTCPYCPFSTAHASYLPIHITTQHTKDFEFVCSVCGKGFVKRPDLEDHMKELHLSTFKCDIYNVHFTSVLALKGYKKCSEQTHSEQCPFSPDYKKGTLDHHLLPSDKQVHRCEPCDRAFAQKRHLTSHLRTCQKATKLPNHKKSPAEKELKRFRCTQCPFSTNIKRSLHLHTVNHSGKLPYKCEICVKAFLQKYQLQTHMLAHSGERPYACSICGRKFYRLYHMQRHEKIHTQKLKSEVSSS